MFEICFIFDWFILLATFIYDFVLQSGEDTWTMNLDFSTFTCKAIPF
jgi:hypothetical protein